MLLVVQKPTQNKSYLILSYLNGHWNSLMIKMYIISKQIDITYKLIYRTISRNLYVSNTKTPQKQRI